jgi:putative two-component system response regulator
MPDMNGYELCRALKNRPITRFTPVVLVTGSDDEDARLAGIQAGADDFLRKPVRTQELMARVSSLIRLKRAIDDLDSVETLVLSLARTVEARDSYTAGHCERMAYLAGEFGAHLGLPTDAVAALRRGGYLHDVGKISLPDAILRKVGPLTEDEFTQMKRHTIVGDALCADLRLLHSVRPIVRQHHERLDGSGYPDGAKGDDISLLAQIIGIVDVFDALTTERPYRRAMCPKDAYEHLRCEAAKKWRRADLVEEFVALGVTGGFGSQFALP